MSLVKTQDIMAKIGAQVLGGAKVPHETSFPMIRKEEDGWKLAVFICGHTAQQLKQGVMQRPSRWGEVDLADGSGYIEYRCSEKDFCTAPADRLYKRGEAKRKGTREDVGKLYAWMDSIREYYLQTGTIDAFAYRQYQTLLFEVISSGQINFYRELSRLR